MAQLERLETVSNNLAHANEPGFKRDEVTFEEVRAKLTDGADPTLPRNRDRRFVESVGTRYRMEVGPLSQTENPLDVALRGPGFLRVSTPEGERLTRDGRMVVDRQGTLRTIRGHLVLDEGGGEITLPYGKVPAISRQGDVTADGVRVARLGVGIVRDPAQLSKLEGGLFASRTPVESLEHDQVDVLQGFVEESNVNAVEAVTQLVEVQRTFEALQQVVSAYRRMDEQATRLLK
jgi:flagellar basal body rod protein FlgG